MKTISKKAPTMLVLFSIGVCLGLSTIGRAAESAPFARITNQPPGSLVADSFGAAWGDYDQDGLVDLFVANLDSFDDFLYRNLGNGNFELQASSPVSQDGIYSYTGSWSDFDGDGDLDLFVTTTNSADLLYEQDENGQFSLNTTSTITQQGGYSLGGSWADYDGDGWLDLAVANAYTGLNFLFKSQGNGNHIRITDAPVGTDSSFSQSASWVDFDGDGDVDLLVTGSPTYLYRNGGVNGFTNVTDSPISSAAVTPRVDVDADQSRRGSILLTRIAPGPSQSRREPDGTSIATRHPFTAEAKPRHRPARFRSEQACWSFFQR
jgi:hypothetical protein